MLTNAGPRRLAAAVVLLGAVLWGYATPGRTAAPIERYVADAMKTGFPGPVASGIVEMDIERWSTDAERDRLRSVLIEDNPSKLLDVLTKLPRVGYIRTPGSLGYDLHYARRHLNSDGSTHVIMATNRFISFWEATRQPRSIDYPFTLIEMHIGPDGNGEGKISLATKITYDSDTKEVTLEDYESQPVLLSHVHREDINKKK